MRATALARVRSSPAAYAWYVWFGPVSSWTVTGLIAAGVPWAALPVTWTVAEVVTACPDR